MLDPANALLSPQLAQAPIATLLEYFPTVLPWLSDAYALVQTGTAKDGKTKLPQLYRQDGSLHHIDVHPDDKMKSLLFFERNGVSTIEWNDPLQQAGTWTHYYAAVMWLNLKLIDPERDYDFTDELLHDFLVNGLLRSPLGSALAFEEAEQRSERIFNRYTGWPEKQQLLMWPYSGFRIPFTVRQPVKVCSPPFASGGVGGGPFLIANGVFLRVNL
jgi:hypothetical protein